MTLSVTEASQPTAVARAPRRIDALDWTKGALILFMVAYHAINYSAFRPLAFRYLAFLPPSFILITGFLVGQVYASKYDLQTWRPYARLAIRGIKLLVIFTVLNVVHCIAQQRGLADGLWEFADRSNAIFLSGNGRTGIFEVLLPIAYFLLLAPFLLWLRARMSAAIATFAVAMFVLCAFLELKGISWKNLGLLSAGFIGMALGLVSMSSIDQFARRWVPILLIYLAYQLSSHYFGENYPIQIFGAIASLCVLYCLALHLDSDSWLGKQMITFGKYSLFAYLVQIAFLRGMVKMVGGRPEQWLGVAFIAVATTAFLVLTVQALDRVRLRSHPLEIAYKSVFA